MSYFGNAVFLTQTHAFMYTIYGNICIVYVIVKCLCGCILIFMYKLLEQFVDLENCRWLKVFHNPKQTICFSQEYSTLIRTEQISL